MILEAIVVAVISWIVAKILDSLNNQIAAINSNYHEVERSYRIVVNNYTQVIYTDNWNALWDTKKIIVEEYAFQWEYYKNLISLQKEFHHSKQELYDKITSHNYDKQTKIDAHKVVQKLKSTENEIKKMIIDAKSKIDETHNHLRSIKDKIESLKRKY